MGGGGAVRVESGVPSDILAHEQASVNLGAV